MRASKSRRMRSCTRLDEEGLTPPDSFVGARC